MTAMRSRNRCRRGRCRASLARVTRELKRAAQIVVDQAPENREAEARRRLPGRDGMPGCLALNAVERP